MNIERVTPTRDIGGDFLFLVDGRYIRARFQRTTPDSAILAAVQDAVELVHFKFSCAFATDDSGNVARDAANANIIFAAEVHSVSLESLAAGQSIEAWIADRLDDVVAKAARKAFYAQQIGGRYRLPTPAG